jgi:ankyrin repeat protein
MILTDFDRALISNDRPAIVRMLDEEPGLVNQRDDKGRTPIDLAVSRSSPEVVELLIQRGADINKRDEVYGSTPLRQVVARDRKEIAEVLLRHGVDIAMKNNAGETAYELAVGLGRTEIAEMLQAVSSRLGE